MRPIDVFAIAAAIVIALLSLVVEPWSGQWWIALLTASFVALWTFLHIVLGGGARWIVKLTAIVFLVIAGPWFGYWYWSNYPTSLKLVQARFPALYISQPKAASPTINSVPRTVTATLAKAYYNCKTKEGHLDQAAIETNSAAFKSYIEPYAEAYGYKPPTITVVAGGDKVDLVPINNPPVNTPTKRTFQIVKVGKELTGVYSAQFLISAYGDYPLVLNSGVGTTICKVIAGLAGVEPVDCELQ